MDYTKWFDKFSRTSFEADGTARVYGNDMEEIYQMFKARLLEELQFSNINEPSIDAKKVM